MIHGQVDLVTRLDAINLAPTVMREILLSCHAGKLTRTYVDDRQLVALVPCLEAVGLSFIFSKHKILHQTDSGKGGFANGIAAFLPEDSPVGCFTIYIGRDITLLEEARNVDECGDHESFGALLEIPRCCRSRFIEHLEIAAAKQNDFTGFVSMDKGVNSWCIHYGQYFGYGLISHFPCSFSCQETAGLARLNYQVLCDHASNSAEKFLRYQTASYLYTEYDGIYAFFSVNENVDGSSFYRNGWFYDNTQIIGTHSGILFELLKKGNPLTINERNRIVLSGSELPGFEFPQGSAIICFHVPSGKCL